MRLLDARVYHFDKDVGVVPELYHQLLVLLHVSERVLVDQVGVVEEKIVLGCKFNFNVLDLSIFALYKVLDHKFDLPIAKF